MKKIFKEEIFKAAKDFSDEQGEVPPVFAFQEGIKWLLNKQKEKQNRINRKQNCYFSDIKTICIDYIKNHRNKS